MNEILFVLSMLAVFTVLVLTERFFGKSGLFAWAATIPVLANILTAKQITVFGLDVTMGTILFASIFLCTDILSEKYNKKDAKKAALLSAFFLCGYIIIAQAALLFVPNSLDFAHDSMSNLFGASIRITIASVVMFVIANLVDIWIYNAMKKKSEKHLWLRNNVATISSNCLENFLFVILAFWGTMPAQDCLFVALCTSFIEVIVSVCDTPFLYWARRSERKIAD
jgi:uncharacterized integral membrane protein (TIGR00697 family)